LKPNGKVAEAAPEIRPPIIRASVSTIAGIISECAKVYRGWSREHSWTASAPGSTS
jgi:hypothetical protein